MLTAGAAFGPYQVLSELARGGAAVAQNGDVLAVDSRNNRVSVFSPDGQLLAETGTRGVQAGQFQGAAGIAVVANGLIYVTELDNGGVQRLVLP